MSTNIMFDTHCHLNFQQFIGKEKEVINRAKAAGVNYFVIPGTDEESSQKAVEIAEKYEGVYAAVGIHPHHVFEMYKGSLNAEIFISSGNPPFGNPKSKKFDILAHLLNSKNVVAVGEVGIDRHVYQNTKYAAYQIDEKFIELQKEYLKAQIDLAVNYNKSLILHNREAKDDFLAVLKEKWDDKLSGRTVFHCCEPDRELLNFAKEHQIYIGVDGDITYSKEKQALIKSIPLEMLVLETDSPYLLPRPRQGFGGQAEPLRYPNEPKNLLFIAEFIACLISIPTNKLIETTTNNAKKLFNIS